MQRQLVRHAGAQTNPPCTLLKPDFGALLHMPCVCACVCARDAARCTSHWCLGCFPGMQPSTFGVIPDEHNLPDQPLLGTLAQCAVACNDNPECVAFSWQVAANAAASDNMCYLKNTAAKEFRVEFRGWTTYVARCPPRPTAQPTRQTSSSSTAEPEFRLVGDRIQSKQNTLLLFKDPTLSNRGPSSDLLETTDKTTLWVCALQCLAKDHCRAFALRQDKHKCNMYRSTVLSGGFDKMEKWIHYALDTGFPDRDPATTQGWAHALTLCRPHADRVLTLCGPYAMADAQGWTYALTLYRPYANPMLTLC